MSLFEELFIPSEDFTFTSVLKGHDWATDFDVRFMKKENYTNHYWRWTLSSSSIKSFFKIVKRDGFTSLKKAREDFIKEAQICLPSEIFKSAEFKLRRAQISTHFIYAPSYHTFINNPEQSILRTDGSSGKWYFSYGTPIQKALNLHHPHAPTRRQVIEQMQTTISSNLPLIYKKCFYDHEQYYQAKQEIETNTWHLDLLHKDRRITDYGWWLMLIKPEVDLAEIFGK